MNTKIVRKQPVMVIGTMIRTTNKDWQYVNDIPPLWNKFLSEGFGEKIKNKLHPETSLGVYMDYDTDEMGMYTFLIGYEVSSLEEVPEGMTAKIIPASSYYVVTPKGKMPEMVGEAWNHVWNAGLKRSYTGDFELYDSRNDGTENAEMDVYISIQE